MNKKLKIRCKTGEITNFKLYYNTQHWNILKKLYMDSNLSKICYICKKSNNPIDFHHRTKRRIGNEHLLDIMPVCNKCINLSKTNKGKKKAERYQLSSFAFHPDKIDEKHKQWMLSIDPKYRGAHLSKYYSNKAKEYHPSKFWINAQVNKTCKWIHKQEKVMIFSLLQQQEV